MSNTILYYTQKSNKKSTFKFPIDNTSFIEIPFCEEDGLIPQLKSTIYLNIDFDGMNIDIQGIVESIIYRKTHNKDFTYILLNVFK